MDSKELRDCITGKLSYELQVVPIRLEEDTVVLATPTPDDEELSRKVSWILNRPTKFVFCTTDWLHARLLELYGLEAELNAIPDCQETIYSPYCNWLSEDGRNLMVLANGYTQTCFWNGAMQIPLDSEDIDFWRWLIATPECRKDITENELELLKVQWQLKQNQSK